MRAASKSLLSGLKVGGPQRRIDSDRSAFAQALPNPAAGRLCWDGRAPCGLASLAPACRCRRCTDQSRLGARGSLASGPSSRRRCRTPVRRPRRAATRRIGELTLPKSERLMRRFWRMKPMGRHPARGLEAGWTCPLIANDWPMLPVAVEAAAAKGGIVVYDSHEMALEEFAEKPEWRRFVRPVVAHVEESYISHAKVISSVSPGITAHLRPPTAPRRLITHCAMRRYTKSPPRGSPATQ